MMLNLSRELQGEDQKPSFGVMMTIKLDNYNFMYIILNNYLK